MKNATPNASSTIHLDSDIYNKPHTSGKPSSPPYVSLVEKQDACKSLSSKLIHVPDAILHVLKTGYIDQLHVFKCDCPAKQHIVDLAPIVEKLRDQGHNIIDEQGALISGSITMRQRLYFMRMQGSN
tara:strand:+ start:87 stop:467 length:381 start_codon:yes stop_codon:yes gene_type:complete